MTTADNHRSQTGSVRRGTRALGAFLVPAALLLMSACGSSNAADTGPSSGATGTSSGASSEAGTTAKTALAQQSQPIESVTNPGGPIDAKDLAGKTVFYIPLVGKAEYFQLVDQILKSTFTEVGVKLQTCDGQANPSGIGACLDQAVNSKADAVITDYIPYELAPTSFDKLVTAGIPVYVAGESAPDGVKQTDTLRFDNPDVYQQAEMEGIMNAAIADSDGKGHILFLNTEDDPAVKRAGQYAQEYVKKACPDCVLTTKRVTISQIQNVPSLVSSTLVSDPSIKYVIPQYDSYLPPAITGVQSSGKAEDVKLSSANASLANLPPVKTNPQVIAAVGFDTAYSAWRMVDASLRLMAGEVPPETYPISVRAFNKDNVGDLTLTPEAQSTGEWFGDNQAWQNEFRKTWGIQ